MLHDATPPPMYDQFVVSQTPMSTPEGFLDSSRSGWCVATSPTLPLTTLSSGGRDVGWILGWALLEDGSFSHDHASLEVPEPAETSDDPFERFLYTLPGRWTAFALLNGALRVFVDPSASLGTVYSRRYAAIGSTTTMLTWADPYTLSADRFRARTLRKNQSYPGGLTSDPLISRILPNHYLDTSNWSSTRHWPKGELRRVNTSAQVKAATDGIAKTTATTMAGLASQATLILPLTSGRDSRILMSAIPSHVGKCEFVTFEYHDFRKSDMSYAKSQAKKLGLRHRMLDIPVPTEADERVYLEAVGYDANEGKARDFYLAASALPSDRGWITGYVGEVGRGFFWRSTDDPDVIPPIPDLLERMRLDPTPANIDVIAQWLETAPYTDINQMLDLLYLEHRQGAWASTQLYGAAPFRFSIIPLNLRSTIEAMLRLPIDYVRGGEMPRDIARVGWPELAELDYDRRPGLVGRLEYLAFVIRRDGGRLFRRVTGTKSR